MARRKFQGQVAIITGGGRGIGAATALQLADAGASLVLTARSEEQLEAIVGQIRKAGGTAIGVPGDVSDLEHVEEIVESAVDHFGRIDILINNAAVIWPVEQVVDADPEEWAYGIHVNLIAPFYLTNNVLPLMLDQKYGRIVNISSGSAIQPVAGNSAYCTAKAGLDMFTRVLAIETSGTGVTTNALHPGMVDTEMQADIRSVDTTETSMDFQFWHDYHARGDLIRPGRTARLILWLAGPWSREYSGTIFDVADSRWVDQVEQDLNA